MKKFIQLGALTGFTLLLGACTTLPQSTKPQALPKIQPSPTRHPHPKMPAHHAPVKALENALLLIKNQTTEEEVIAFVGSPTIITPQKDDSSVWIYQNTLRLAGVTDENGHFLLRKLSASSQEKSMTIILHFDNRGIIQTYKGLVTSL